jgi:hypothetical protein
VRSTLLALIMLSSAQPALAQPASQFVFDHVWIRQSLKDKNTINEPAFVNVTFPEEGDSARQVAVAGSFLRKAASTDPGFNYGAGLQFTENTAVGERQNLLTVAGEAVWVTAAKPGDLFSRIKGTAGFKRNGEKQTKGLSATAYWSIERSRVEERPTSGIPIGDAMEWTPQVGIEFEDALAAAIDADEGHTGLLFIGTAINIYPLPAQLRKRVILTAELAYRRNVISSFDPVDRDHPYGRFGLAIALDSLDIFAIAVDHVRGEDPTEAFSGPAFTRVALTVHLAKPQKRAYFFRLFNQLQLR